MTDRPVAVVLTTADRDRPPYLDELTDRLDLRLTDADGLADALPGASVLFLWDFFSTAVEGAWPAADALEWIHVAAAGVDSLLFDELRDSEVVVTNARGVFDRPIAEFVLASVLAQAKLLHESRELQRRHEWRHREPAALAGSTALVVGTGAIAREIARLLTAVGVEVRGAGRRPADDDPDLGRVVSSRELADHVGWADHVINATPLTPQTTGLFDAAVFAAMRPGAHFVNIGRGASVVEADLVEALESGPLAAASLDVFETEPLPENSPLWDAPGLVVSAHMSGDVVGWRDTLARQFADLAERWLAGEPLTNVVDKRLGYVSGGA
ncbi:D-2-hydroxyacid dehydrogenase [Nocardioides rotundus]|uniref:D-2-hydroxyacid dehydrogenase n=1 Tax=Nocardioides rotundus TaxID=1774216 RepID=UPI001CBF0C81|nr:D-2-hydroxyacid dehydrogenase [Nocardioides rotundus]